jgi:putative endonuclease
MPKHYAVDLLASRRNGTLYIGSTSNLIQRIHQHKTGEIEGFTKQYQVDQLVWYEMHDSSLSMVTRERQLKQWNRQWKIDLVEKDNPEWRDLYPAILG